MSEILRSINPAMANLLLPAAPSATRPLRQRREPAPYVDEEEERSLAGSLRDKSLTMIGAVGNLLDLPGSMARDVASSVVQGQFVNPFDQLMSPLSADNRTTGKELNRQIGFTNDDDSWTNAIGGFATEVLADPLTYMTFGGSALGKAGRAASNAGLFDEIASVAARKQGQQLGQVGSRQARLTTTLGDMAQFGSERTAQKAQEIIANDPALADEAFGGLVGFGLPFMQPSAIAGTGARSQAVAKGMDTAARAARFAKIPGTELQPINSLLNLFDAPAMGTQTAFGQALAREHSRAKDVTRSTPMLDANRAAVELEEAGMLDQASADLVRQGLEGVIPIDQLPATLQPMVRRMRAETGEMPQRAREAGVQLTELTDDEIDYAARFLVASRGIHGKRSAMVFNADDPSQFSRKDFLRNVPGGTVALRELLKDPAINDLIDNGATHDAVRDAIEAKAKGWLPDIFKEFDPKNKDADPEGWVLREGRYKEIAKFVGQLSRETRDAGVFGNHPILDHQARRMAFEDAINATKTVAKGLSQPDILLAPSIAANTGADGSMAVSELLKSLKMNLGDSQEGLGRKILELRGEAVTDDAVQALGSMRIGKQHAEELRTINKVISGPEAINDLVKMVDSVTNYSKGFWTSVWPAFHVRNRMSGALHNMALGIWSKAGDSDANLLYQGGVIKGAANEPWVRAEWERRLAKDAAASGQAPPNQPPGQPGQVPGPGQPPGPGGQMPGQPGAGVSPTMATPTGEFVEIDGIARPTVDSNGKPIHTTEEGVRNFWSAFRESKLVDDQGRPIPIYHGTRNADLGTTAAKDRNRKIDQAKLPLDEWNATHKQSYSDLSAQRYSAIEAEADAHDRIASLLKSNRAASNATRASSWQSFSEGVKADVSPETWRTVDKGLLKQEFDRLQLAKREAESIQESLDQIPKKPSSSLATATKGSEAAVFDTMRYGENDTGYLSAGTYFTKNAELSGNYAGAGEGAGVIPVYANLKNPFVHGVTNDPRIDEMVSATVAEMHERIRAARGSVDDYSRANSLARRKVLEDLGYDGEIYERGVANAAGAARRDLAESEVVVFRPEQVKSAIGNRGTFDPGSPDIMATPIDRTPPLPGQGQLAVAIRVPDTGEIIYGKVGETHGDLLADHAEKLKFNDATPDSHLEKIEAGNGFIDSDGNFLTRGQAAERLGINRDLASEELNARQGIGRTDDGLGGDAAPLYSATPIDRTPPETGFFSKTRNVIDSAKQNMATGQQWMGMLKSGGAKAEELQDLGLEEFLKSKPKATKQEVLNYIDQNTPEISITEKGYAGEGAIRQTGAPQFEGYKVPGGDPGTYREVLMKIPAKDERSAFEAQDQFGRAMHRKYGDGWRLKQLDPEDAARDAEIRAAIDNPKPSFRGSHWSEPNVVAHIRLDDISNPDGTKTLRVTEMQSDWHQEGRKQGYGPVDTTGWKATPSERVDLFGVPERWEVVDATGKWVRNVDGDAANADDAIANAAAIESRSSVPDGPFKKSWSKLAFKQAIKMAVEEGYDEVGLVVGRDAAKAVGGPVDELSEAYRIMLKDAKEYTKKYGSYVGETEVPGVKGAGAKGVSWSPFSQDGRYSTALDGDGVPSGQIETITNPDGTKQWAARFGDPNFEDEMDLLGTFKTQEEARAAVAREIIDSGQADNIDDAYDGGLHIFKITDQMRKDITEQGQPLYSVGPTRREARELAKALKPVAIPKVGNQEINKWTEEQINWVKDPKNFKSLSPQHEKLNGFLDYFVAKKAIKPEDADILRIIYSQTDARYLPDEVNAGRVLKTQQGNKVTGALGFAEAKQWHPKDRVSLLSKARKGSRDQSSAYNEGTRVMLHELAHIVYFAALRSNDPAQLAVLREFHKLAGTAGKPSFIDEFMSGGNTKFQAEYHAGASKHRNNLTNPEWEQFAEFFAHSIMRRKIPTGAFGQVITKALDWLRTQLSKLASVTGLQPSVRQRLDEIMDELGGFNNAPDLSATLQGGRRAGQQGGQQVPPTGQVPPGQPPVAPPGQGVAPGGPLPGPPAPSGPPVLTDEEATKIIGQMLAADGVTGKFEGNATSVTGVVNQGQSADIRDTLSGIARPGVQNFQAGRAMRKAAGIEPGTSWNPLDVRGVGGREESGLGLAAAGEEIGARMEFLNRAGPWLTMMRRGYDRSEAAKRIGAAQVLYGNKNYTPFEQQVMARLFPFYKFSRGSMPVIVRHLMERPGGPYGTLIKANNRAQGDGELTPDYVRDTANIPIDPNNPIMSMIAGTPPPGTDRYITGFGLMHEDALSFGPSIRGAGLEALSRMNPFIKAPLEWATGQTFFQRGPEGGRDLDRLDPTVGRFVANLMGQTGQDDSKKFPLWMEHLVANSPIARLTTTARALSDPRKRSETVPFMPGPAALFNTLSGVRVSDVSPGSKDAILREMLNSEMEDAGASVFERVYFSEADKAKMSPEARESAMRLQGLANVLARRAKERAAEREAAEAKK
jgi:hypothetical protein